MREDEEFEVVRSLISTPWPEAPEPPRSLRKPVTFREIDGQELARQYVAHRELAQTEALEQEIELPKPPKPGVNGLGDYVPEPPPAVQLRGGLFSWARRLFTARGEN
jgi:hypothetical protein